MCTHVAHVNFLLLVHMIFSLRSVPSRHLQNDRRKKTCILIRSTSSPLNFHFWSRTEQCLDTKSLPKSWNREGSNCWCRAVNTLLLGPDVACSFQFALLPQDVTRNGQHNCQNFIMAKSRGFNFYRFLHLDCLEFSLNK